MADTKTTDTKAVPAAKKPASLSAEAAYAAAASAEPVTAEKAPAPKATATNKKALQDMAAKLQAQLEKLTATAQERAKEVADRAVEVSKDAVEFNRLNVETLVESGKITAKGAQEIGQTNVKYTRENFVEASNALKSSFNVATPKDFVEVQADFMRSSLDRVMDQTSNNMDAVTKLAGKAYQPIADRVSTIRKEIKKAA